jgi:cyclopentanol dehydrogenase
MARLQNKTAIITGAAGGMGAAVALLFAKEGACVVATDVQLDKLKLWTDQAAANGLRIYGMKHDVTSETDWQKVVDQTLSLYGHIDVLVNNAGVYPGFVDCESTNVTLWGKLLSINLTGPFLGCKACIPHLRKNKSGSIINIASIAGVVGGNGTAYSASKGGLLALSRDLAVTLAKDKIRVNAISPGGVVTPMTESLIAMPEMKEKIKSMSPQGRMAVPDEIAWAAVYLASDESSFMTGANMVIDGGAVAV